MRVYSVLPDYPRTLDRRICRPRRPVRQHNQLDIEIIDTTGKVISEAWSPDTIDAWDAERPGRGNRFYTND